MGKIPIGCRISPFTNHKTNVLLGLSTNRAPVLLTTEMKNQELEIGIDKWVKAWDERKDEGATTQHSEAKEVGFFSLIDGASTANSLRNLRQFKDLNEGYIGAIV